MKALVTRLMSDGRREKVLVADWPDPGDPTGNQVRTQTICSGITNGTERNDLLGGNYAHQDEALPTGWGYQNVGQVVATGPEVRELTVGDFLYLSADHQEYVLTPEDGLLVKLSSEIDRAEAALFGMASVAMHTCRHADLRMGERVLVVGQGCIGQFAAQIASAMGARTTVCDIDSERLDVARQIGAAESVLDVSGDGRESHVAEGTFDAVIDLAGVPGMEDKLINAVRKRGRVMLIAGRFGVSYTFNTGQHREVTIKQNSHFDREDLENLARLVARGTVSVSPLIRNVLPVTEADRVYTQLRDHPSELLGTVFEWQ